MTDLMTIHGVHFQRIEYRGQPVVTLRTVDRLHKRPIDTARKSFNRHKDRFIENEDFFRVPFDEWSQMLDSTASNEVDTPPSEICTAVKSGQRNPMIFITKSGYLMVVKPFDDDRAWRVQREMVNTYFAAKKMIEASQQPPAPEQIDCARADGLRRGLMLSDLLRRHNLDMADLARYCYYRGLGLYKTEVSKLFDITKDKALEIERGLEAIGIGLPDPGPSNRRKKLMMELLDSLLGLSGKPMPPFLPQTNLVQLNIASKSMAREA